MRKRILPAVLFAVVTAVSARAGVNVNVDIPLLPPTVVIDTAPRFIYSPALGFYVSTGSPYDIVYVGNSYYLYNNGYYYRSASFNGPWVGVHHRGLPPGLRRHNHDFIRHHRDAEFRRYNRDPGHYRGRWHDPGGGHRGGRGGDHRGGGGHGGGGDHRGGGGHGGGGHGGGGHGGGGR